MSTDPGWYPDEDDPELARYWDGSAWTDRTKARAQITASVLERRVSMKAVLVGLGAVVGLAALVLVGLVVLGSDDGQDVDTAAPPVADEDTEAATSTTADVGAEPMTVERMLNVELPDLTAEGGFSGGQLEDGTVTVDGETLSTSEATISIVDITGDGVDDGLALVTQDFGAGGNAAPPHDLYLYDADGTFLDALHNLSDFGGSFDFPAVAGDTLTFEVLSLGPGDPRCCPSVQTTVQFRWNGTEFEPV